MTVTIRNDSDTDMISSAMDDNIVDRIRAAERMRAGHYAVSMTGTTVGTITSLDDDTTDDLDVEERIEELPAQVSRTLDDNLAPFRDKELAHANDPYDNLASSDLPKYPVYRKTSTMVCVTLAIVGTLILILTFVFAQQFNEHAANEFLAGDNSLASDMPSLMPSEVVPPTLPPQTTTITTTTQPPDAFWVARPHEHDSSTTTPTIQPQDNTNNNDATTTTTPVSTTTTTATTTTIPPDPQQQAQNIEGETNNNDDTSNTIISDNDNVENPNFDLDDSLDFDELRDHLFELSGDALYNETSAQHQALDWVYKYWPTMPDSILEEVYILAVLFFSTSGATWKHRAAFLTPNEPVCSWHIASAKGAYCEEPTHSNITAIRLGTNFLDGNIPSELQHLYALKKLDFSVNRLKGSIPSHLMTLTDLNEIKFYGNQLSGTIPTHISSATHLEHIDLSNNQNIHGTIPSEIGLLSVGNLRYIDFSYNQLTGSIPTQIGSCWQIQDLRLQHNFINGKIPSEIGLFDTAKFEVLELNDNQLVGTVPTYLGNLYGIKTLNLQNNMLTGDLGSIYCQSGERETMNDAFKSLSYIKADSCSLAPEVTCQCCCCDSGCL